MAGRLKKNRPFPKENRNKFVFVGIFNLYGIVSANRYDYQVPVFVYENIFRATFPYYIINT